MQILDWTNFLKWWNVFLASKARVSAQAWIKIGGNGLITLAEANLFQIGIKITGTETTGTLIINALVSSPALEFTLMTGAVPVDPLAGADKVNVQRRRRHPLHNGTTRMKDSNENATVRRSRDAETSPVLFLRQAPAWSQICKGQRGEARIQSTVRPWEETTYTWTKKNPLQYHSAGNMDMLLWHYPLWSSQFSW